MNKALSGGRKAALFFTLLFLGCTSPVNIPLPLDHPAYGFYQTANAFPVSGRSCLKIGGSLKIRPDQIGLGREYEKIHELAPGLFLVRQNLQEHEFIVVLFLEYGLTTSIPKACSWDVAEFPINQSARK